MNTPLKKTLIVWLQLALLSLCLIIGGSECYAQPNPPRPISIYTYPEQGLQFGAFTHGVLGGTVIISPEGFRTTTGDVIQLNLGHTFSAALIEVEGEPGTRVQIIKGPDVELTGSSGGTLLLSIGVTDPISPFTINMAPPSRVQLRVGGTLTVGSPLVNPPGAYNGTFSLIFIQE